MANALGINGYDYAEFYVGSAKMVAYWHARAMGLEITGYAGPETGVKDRVSYLLTKNRLKIMVTSAIRPDNYEVSSFVTRHGDGVKRWGLCVDDVKAAFSRACEQGGVPIRPPRKITGDGGYVEDAAIRLYDDSEIFFSNYDHYRGLFRPGFEVPGDGICGGAVGSCEDTGLMAIDHIVGNVRENEMNLWADYINRSLDFETFIEFGPGDISTKYSALLSKVVRSKDSVVKNPINEPYAGIRKSQIEEYIDEYNGTGIQHIALSTDDIVGTIRAMRKNGVAFLTVPDTYYDMLAERKASVGIVEDIEDLKTHGILCDTDEREGYLLQLFTKPIGDRPTFFYEIIQRRKGAQGFGQGNFQALFESIERDQARRGNL